MGKYLLTLTTKTEGETTSLTAEGELTQTQSGRKLNFRYEEGKTDFFLDEGKLVRSGDYGLALLFRVGEKTEAILSLGENEGKIPMKTLKYELFEEEEFFRVTMQYILKLQGGYRKTEVVLEAKKSR